MGYLDSAFSNHYIFNAKNQGTVKSLRGDVIIVAFYVSDTVSSWDEASIEQYDNAIGEALWLLKNEAAKDGVKVDFRMAAIQRTASVDCDRHNRDTWLREVTCCDVDNGVDEYQAYYRKYYPCDELAVLFVFNKPLRDYASSASKKYPTYGEFSVLSKTPIKRDIVHELLHQFGAKDLYYPDEVRTIAHRILPESVMNVGSKIVIDSLTRNLIGWRDSLDHDAYAFLNATKHLTEEYIQSELRKIWAKEDGNT